MGIPFKNSIAISFSLIASFASMSHAMGIKVSGEPAIAPTEKVLVQGMRAEGLTSQRIAFAPVSQEKWQQVREQAAKQKMVQIGFARGASDMVGGVVAAKAFSELKFAPTSKDKSIGGVAALLEVHSPQAQSLRVGIDVAALPEGIELRFRGNGAAQALQGVLGPHTTNDIQQMTQGIHTYWSPMTEGDTQWIEIYAPDAASAAKVKLNFNSISHIDSSISTGLKPSLRISGVENKRLIDIGDAGSCNIGVACVDNPSQALQNAIASVAKMVFTTGGSTGLCTGTLVNDNDRATQIPYLMGGNHCFDNKLVSNGAPTGLSNKTPIQMQAVASTLNTYFNFQSLTCGSNSNLANFTQLTRGSVFLYNEAGYDALLLRLNDAAPAGSYLTGYDSTAARNGDSIFGIHHPGGDLKKISQGTVTGTATLQVFTSPRREVFTEVAWTRGVTEGGSSGSAFYTFANGEYLLRGTLWGGVSSCSAPNEPDYYSFLPNYFASISQYLGSGQAAPNYTDIWYNASESGWGLNITHHPSPNNQIFAVWYTYGEDGLPRWYTMSGGRFVNPTTFVGGAFRTVGPPQTTSFFNRDLVGVTTVGEVTLTFDPNGRDATFNYSFAGTNYTRSITRLPF